MEMGEKNQYIEQYIRNIAQNNPDIFTDEIIHRAINTFKNSEESLEILIPKIESMANNFLEKNIEQKKYLQEMAEKYKGTDYQTINIDNLDISRLSYTEMESLLFHYSWKKYLEVYDKTGMKSVIGENSQGIDPEASIFFSKGVEGVLELWDVWLKWRLNRQNNPQFNGNTNEEIQETLNRFRIGNITDEERKKWYYWMEYFKDKKYLENNSMLEKLFEYQYNEMINSDYLVLNLKENEEYKSDQIDIKKFWAIENAKKTGRGIDPLTSTQYGVYSDFSTPVVDKWNMQTIPGKDIVIEPGRIKRLNINGKTDVYSIMKFMYDKYKKEISEEKQVRFDVLDRYVEYVEEKRINMGVNKDENVYGGLIEVSNNQPENKPQPVQNQLSSSSKKTELFSQRSQSEIQVHQQIKEKNMAIKHQKEAQRALDKPKVKTLTKSPNNGNGSSSSGGFVDTLVITLITGFIAGTLFMIVYSLIK